ncbi:Mu transposase C-terminal domain-containing protein [Methylobacterium radiotolerans]|uniref:Mu transposase C-terminal domain-containing protein n=1 Tax=Methylobacterium radiotolerans TaxID=31998 RepID=UPI000D5C768B|nr:MULTISPECIES: Mu transposase C-terminal domain-containing protein [Methylobacterium]MDE3749567.1 Mu transposase C-terminal domain-containing protein [Methylobacterium radiotolerans]PVZ05953.1 putative transposase [Methylobacterium organophilum]
MSTTLTLPSYEELLARPPDDAPLFEFRAGDFVSIGRGEDHSLRRLEFERVIPGRPPSGPRPAGPRLLRFSEVPGGSQIFLADRDVALLQREGRFRIELLNEDPARPRKDAPTPLGLTDEEIRYADRHLAYVTACLAMPGGYRKSRPAIRPIIAEVARQRGETPPDPSTVMRQVEKWSAQGDRLAKAALIRTRRFANTAQPWPPYMLAAMRSCTYRALQMPKATSVDALALLRVEMDERYPGETIALPDLRTMQRERAKVDLYIRDHLRKGSDKAGRDHAAYYERALPALPLEEVEVDHTTFDILLIDEESQLVFGRPDVIAIRCRRTGMILGIGIGWEVPSFASFIEAVRHAMYEKDLTPFPSVKTGWPCRGRWKRMHVDNAMHFLGISIAHAANELKFQIIELQPGAPMMKGAEERLLGILNSTVAHNLPGTTLSNTTERKEHQEALEPPCLTLREFEAFLVTYICDEYHCAPHIGLGPLRTLPDIPIRLWQAEIGKVKIRDLPHPDVFASLAGDVDHRTIQHYGIEWDYLRYQSDELISLRIHPEHKAGKGRHRGTQYRVTRDPQDLSRIWVYDPYRKIRIEVPAVRQDYAGGLTLHQHRVIIAHHLRTVGKAVDIDGLLRTRGAMLVEIEALRKRRRVQGIERKLARFLGQQKAKRIRSRIVPANDSATASAEPLDIEDPSFVRGPEVRSPQASNLNRRVREDPERVRQVEAEPGQPPNKIARMPKKDAAQAAVKAPPATASTELEAIRNNNSDWDDV